MEPLQKLAEDITYLTGCDGTLYMNTIEDMYNGEILAYAISSSPDAALCIETVNNLHERFQNLDGVILHTDLGSSYMSAEYRSIAEGFGLRLSTGRTAICYDNAAMESLNGIIKTEALYCRFGKTRVKDRRVPVALLKSAVIEFIDYYNNRRPKRYISDDIDRETERVETMCCTVTLYGGSCLECYLIWFQLYKVLPYMGAYHCCGIYLVWVAFNFSIDHFP